MLSRKFASAIRGFHHFRRYWSPEKAEKLICLHEGNNFSTFLILKHAKKMV